MKKLLLLMLIAPMFVSCNISRKQQSVSETTSIRHTRPFDRIVLNGAFDVKFTQGDTFSVKVVGSEKQVKKVETQFSGTTLTVSYSGENFEWHLRRGNWTPTLYITSPDLVALTLNGAGDVEMQNDIDTDTLSVYLKGVGDINFKRVVCDEFYCTLNGTGDIDVQELTALHSFIELRGTGDVGVKFQNSGMANCVLQGTGDIDLSGTLNSLQKAVHGTGDIETGDLQLKQ